MCICRCVCLWVCVCVWVCACVCVCVSVDAGMPLVECQVLLKGGFLCFWHFRLRSSFLITQAGRSASALASDRSLIQDAAYSLNRGVG